jgi:hypothetical protein
LPNCDPRDVGEHHTAPGTAMLRCPCTGTRGNATARRLRGRVESGFLRSVMWSPSARKSRPTIRGAASGEGIDVLVSVKADQDAERSPPSGLGTAPVLLSPFRARAAHVVQLGPVRVEQRGPEPAPPLGSHVEAAARRGGSRTTLLTCTNLKMCSCRTSPWACGSAIHAVPAAAPSVAVPSCLATPAGTVLIGCDGG